MERIAHTDAATTTGDDAFDAAVGAHYASLVRRLTAVVRDPDEGQDLAQEAILRAYRAWDRFDGTDARAWLFTIGLRLAFHERDRRRRWGGLLGRGAESIAWVAPTQKRGAVLSPPRSQLNAVDGYTQAEIAGGDVLDRRAAVGVGRIIGR